VGENAYKLELPSNLNFYPTLNVSQLANYKEPLEGQKGPPAKAEHAKKVDSVTVEKVIDSRYQKGSMQYLVEWVWKGQQQKSWMPARNLEGAMDKVLEYDQQFV